ncbi:hypothetical protein G3480_03470 [Thiorhodococcus mannitoliphagus]|uniref:Uncharacterized protein n=1 Tax=Thiorhodococcus mannitoliphagus TaxID=329406 RepID=A0A6P1DTM1_9GAMM|nr:hypothetical protein [Thiorhodococcus mannitoliphagus]NEX19382.1 hypothetical protein [Thiorhodococcus mannitoliphagus]
MKWAEVRAEHPNAWLVVEAIQFHEEGDVFVGDDMTAVEKCPDGAAAFAAYRRLHQVYPAREFVFVHTSRQELRVEERRWMDIRTDA